MASPLPKANLSIRSLSQSGRQVLGVDLNCSESMGAGGCLPALLANGTMAASRLPMPQPGSPRYFRITPAGRRACAAEARRLDGIVKTAMAKRLLKKRAGRG